MKKISLSAILLCFSAAMCAGQKKQTPAAPPLKPKQSSVKTASPKQIPAAANKPKQTQVAADKSKKPQNEIDKPKQTAKTGNLKQSAVKPIGAKQPEAKTSTATKVLKPTAAPKPISIKTVPEIPAADWKILTDALTAEDWEKSASLSSRFINRIKTENEKKQLARLRYFYLYSLSGKIFKLAAAKNQGGEKAEKAAFDELRKTAADFIGSEFVLPPRSFLGDCRKSFNYICRVKGSDKAFRTTATGRNGTEILSFDYVLFDKKVGIDEFAQNKTFLGGTLRKAEFNADPAKPWVMRLIFDKGFVRIALES